MLIYKIFIFSILQLLKGEILVKNRNVKEVRLLKDIKETPEQRHARVVAEGGRFQSRKIEMKTRYNRNSKGHKVDLRRASDF